MEGEKYFVDKLFLARTPPVHMVNHFWQLASRVAHISKLQLPRQISWGLKTG